MSVPGHRNIARAELTAGVPDAVEIRALGAAAPVIDDVSKAVADCFAGLDMHVCVLPRYRVVPRVRNTDGVDIPHSRIAAFEHKNIIAALYGMSYGGMVTTRREAAALGKHI